MALDYKALVVEEIEEGVFRRSIQSRSVGQLPDHEVLVEVHYSSLNYKDALSASGNKGVTKQYPHTPGIDAAGTVAESSDSRFEKGDKVIVTSYDLGQNTPGGFGRYIRVPAGWVVPLPEGLSLKESMILGTAGLTAAIGVHHLQSKSLQADDGEVLITGATGGVGTFAVAILSQLGYSVTAATGKMDRKEFLTKLGAAKVIHREEVQDESSRPLLSSRWAGVLETVGGEMLDTAIRQTGHNGVVACCGNILGHQLNTSIYPFILRGVSLMGIDSGNCKMKLRKEIWTRLASSWKPEMLEQIYRECSLEELSEEIEKILKGQQVGRVVVNIAD